MLSERLKMSLFKNSNLKIKLKWTLLKKLK